MIMKILVYTTLFPNHLQPNNAIFIKQRMLHFAKVGGCEIKIVAPVPYCPSWPVLNKWYHFSQIKKHEIIEGVDVYHPKYPLIPKVSMFFHWFFLFISSLTLLKKIHKQFSFDLIDAHYIYPDGLAAIMLGKLLKKPVVLSARGSDIHQFISYKSIKPMIRYTLDQADNIISVSDTLKRQMIELGINRRKITVISNGIDIERFYLEDKIKSRERLSIPCHKKIILSVGSLIPLKGFHLILDAMPVVIRNNNNVHLYMIGKGPYKKYLKQKISQMCLQKYVTLLGERPNVELKTWYNASDIFCLPSSREGCANVILESLACGTPVVATDVGGASEVLISKEFGILIDRNAVSLADGLLQALNRNWNRKKIHDYAAKRTWNVVATEVKTIFDSTLDRFF